MKQIALTLCLLWTFTQYVSANVYDTFHQAHLLFQQGKYSQAKVNFTQCLNDPEFADVKSNVNIWINKCESAIQKQNRNAQIEAERRKRKLAERKNNQYVYISVNALETGNIYTSTVSAMSEVVRQNNRRSCPNIEDALTVVTVSLDIKNACAEDGFYKAKGNGVVRLGSAIDANDFAGQWSVDCEATSAVDADDAKRLLLNKLNHKLGYALDNLLNDRPQESGYYIPEQTIAVSFASDGEKPKFLQEFLCSYISKTPGVTLSTALDDTRNKERDNDAKTQAKYVEMESRAPIRELKGFSQKLRISVIKEDSVDKYYTFVGEISDYRGISLSSVAINGADYGITKLTHENQEFVAKLLAVGLGFKKWIIGEDICGYKLASYNGIHGLLLKVINPTYTIKSSLEEIYKSPYSVYIGGDNSWRYPSAKELLEMSSNQKVLGLVSRYWTEDSPKKKYHYVVDFISSKDASITEYKESKMAAAIVLVKDF